MTICTECGGSLIEYDSAAGNGFCVGCGTVVEENTIVSEVAFGENSSGAAVVQGSFVGQGSTRARMSGPYGNRNSSESREQTLENANRKIRSVGAVMRLSEVVQTAAIRLYTLALEHRFTKGRKNMNVVAVCLYVACRQKETRNYMLIDFSDLLQVNVFELGHTFLQLVQVLNLRLPLIDPSHYISRFAALLEFGDETPKVAADAVRLVARFDRDWMSRGRRPAGICGACLLLAARMNNFRRSVQEVVQVVKIADTTLKKRLDEFKKTPSGALTLADFRTVWLEDEVDPPAYTKGKEREAREKAALEESSEEDEGDGEEVEGEENRKKRKERKKNEKKRKRDDEVTDSPEQLRENASPQPMPIDPKLLEQGIFERTPDNPLFLPEDDAPLGTMAEDSTGMASVQDAPKPTAAEVAIDESIAEEMNTFLHTGQGEQLADALDEAERRKQASIQLDEDLGDLDDAELDAFILTEDEVKLKERIWVEINKDYLEALAAKEALKAGQIPTKSRKKRKGPQKPRDSSTPSGATAADAVRSMMKRSSKYSRRINYDAVESLFSAPSSSRSQQQKLHEGLLDGPEVNLDDKEDYMFTIDDKSDGEAVADIGNVVVEESGGGVGLGPETRRKETRNPELEKGGTSRGAGVQEEDTEFMNEDEGSEKGEDYGWDEEYQQEV